MSEPSSGKRRRRRPQRGAARRANTEAAGQPPGDEPTAGANPGTGGKRRRRSAARKPDAAERSLRELVGAGPSQVGVGGALRARDVNRPTEADLAEAERDLVLVRRHWKPPADGSDKHGSSADVIGRE